MRYTYVRFINVTDRDFVCMYDQESYTIKAGQTEYYPAFLAKHFAKKLADREMILLHKEPMYDKPERNTFILKCLDVSDEKKLDELSKISLKEEIEQQRKELDEAEETDQEVEPEVEPKRRGRKKDDAEFEGSASNAASKLQAKIPEPMI